jgi:GNAT superfamily N-acetyltransferase
MSQITYHRLNASDMHPDMFQHLNRFQQVHKIWRRENGAMALVDYIRTYDWPDDKKRAYVYPKFVKAIASNGAVFAAFDGEALIGAAALSGTPLGAAGEYRVLDMLHISCEYRGKGIGRRLFMLITEAARDLGAKRLYLGANSSEESIAFYRAMGCDWTDVQFAGIDVEEPYEVAMEFLL